MKLGCPVDKPDLNCLICNYSKNLLCDYPYKRDMDIEDIKRTTKGLKGEGKV